MNEILTEGLKAQLFPYALMGLGAAVTGGAMGLDNYVDPSSGNVNINKPLGSNPLFSISKDTINTAKTVGGTLTAAGIGSRFFSNLDTMKNIKNQYQQQNKQQNNQQNNVVQQPPIGNPI